MHASGYGEPIEALPQADPLLLGVAKGLDEGRWAAEVWDTSLRLVAVTDEYVNVISSSRGRFELGLGLPFTSTGATALRNAWPAGPVVESTIAWMRRWGPSLAVDVDDGVAGLRERSDPSFHPALAEVEPHPGPDAFPFRIEVRFGNKTTPIDLLTVKLRRPDGAFAGAATVIKPGLSATVLGMLALGDTRLFERMTTLARPERRPGAVMFADLENSTQLSRRLSSSEYFALIRRLSLIGDDAIVSAGGIVGKHVGDGVTAFFVAGPDVSEASAARSCIEASHALRALTPELAARSGLEPEEVSLRFGMHWGGSLYVGRLITSGRIEATALGDEVNEAARVEACATGGRALASKQLIERLDPDGAQALGLEPGRVKYSALADLPTATEKARRDAPTLAVCEV